MSEVPPPRDGSGKPLKPNNVLIAKREALGWSRARAAKALHRLGESRGLPELESVAKAMYRHETGRAPCRDPLYIELYCELYKSTAQELFGDIERAADSPGGLCGVRSHKIIAAYIGPENVSGLVSRGIVKPSGPKFGLECHTAEVTELEAQCRLYVWPFGVALFHLVEELELPNLAHLAIWRRKTYAQNLEWASSHLSSLTNDFVDASYVLSTYWVHAPSWSANELDTALRIMCIPRVLHERDSELSPESLAHAELVERALLSQGFEHGEMTAFGIKGIALGYASWSGVVYCPIAPKRALSEDEIVAVELATQAMWMYCSHINTEVEQGQDPKVPSLYGWRFLRGVRSRLTIPRPQETEHHKSMRMAILETSGLLDHLSQAIEVLRENE